jgi:hypothetical protein
METGEQRIRSDLACRSKFVLEGGFYKAVLPKDKEVLKDGSV